MVFIKFDVSTTSYYVEVENGSLLHDVRRSWKMIFGVVENFYRTVWEPELCRHRVLDELE